MAFLASGRVRGCKRFCRSGPLRRARSYRRRRRRGPTPAATHRGWSPTRSRTSRARHRPGRRCRALSNGEQPCPTTTAPGDLHVALPPLRPTARARARRRCARQLRQRDLGTRRVGARSRPGHPARAAGRSRHPIRNRPRPDRAPVRLRSPICAIRCRRPAHRPVRVPADPRRSRPGLVGAGPATAPPPGGVPAGSAGGSGSRRCLRRGLPVVGRGRPRAARPGPGRPSGRPRGRSGAARLGRDGQAAGGVRPAGCGPRGRGRPGAGGRPGARHAPPGRGRPHVRRTRTRARPRGPGGACRGTGTDRARMGGVRVVLGPADRARRAGGRPPGGRRPRGDHARRGSRRRRSDCPGDRSPGDRGAGDRVAAEDPDADRGRPPAERSRPGFAPVADPDPEPESAW